MDKKTLVECAKRIDEIFENGELNLFDAEKVLTFELAMILYTCGVGKSKIDDGIAALAEDIKENYENICNVMSELTEKGN